MTCEQEKQQVTIDIYATNNGHIGIDALLPAETAAAMLIAAAACRATGLYFCQPHEGSPVVLDVRVPREALAAVLAPAIAAGVPVRDDEGVGAA